MEVSVETKPVVRKALRWTGDNYDEVRRFTGGFARLAQDKLIKPDTHLEVKTLHGWAAVEVGSWIIRGTDGYWLVTVTAFDESYRVLTARPGPPTP